MATRKTGAASAAPSPYCTLRKGYRTCPFAVKHGPGYGVHVHSHGDEYAPTQEEIDALRKITGVVGALHATNLLEPLRIAKAYLDKLP